MKKRLTAVIIGLIAFSYGYAQTYKVTKSTGRLMIKLPSVTIEGYDGNEVIFTTKNKQFADEQAAGLRLLNGSGMVDNTNIGINVTENGSSLEVNEVASDMGTVTIKIPKGMGISYNWQNITDSGKVIIRNVQKEIEISSRNNTVNLENISGPLTVNTISGSIVARFREKITGPIAITSIYANVDLALPTSIKANLKLNTTYGNVFAASELKIEMKKRAVDDMEPKGNIVGMLNSGGAEINLTSIYGKVYLRKAN